MMNIEPEDTITMPHVLELIGVSHSGPLEPKEPSLWSKLTNYTPNGLILKDISFEVHSGETMTILGSKGSGKKALLNVISHRIGQNGVTRGQILLNDVPLTLRLFQEQCGFVARRTELVSGLTVRQTLTYMARMTLRLPIPGRLPDGNFMSLRYRVRQVLADVALTNYVNHDVDKLRPAERRRLVIGLQLIRDPLLLVLEDPTHGLGPLDTYFIMSVISNHVRKYQRIALLTIDKPRSDIFPFIDRITYLCLGDVLYTGSTTMMMEYFSSIGFPCPETENPLMYFLCLATVDRRNRERFIESSAQIAALVDKFKLEGHEYRKFNPPIPKLNGPVSIPLTAYGKASPCNVLMSLVSRQFIANFIFRRLVVRLGLLPFFYFLLGTITFSSVEETQNSFQTRSAVIFNLLAGITFLVPPITAYYFAEHRNRFYEDSSRLSIYRGPTLIITNILANLPLNILNILVAGSIAYWTLPFRADEYWLERWIVFCAVLWGLATFVEQFTIGLMCFIKSSFQVSLTAGYCLMPLLVLGSTSLRSMVAASNVHYYLNWFNIFYWSSWVLHFNEFQFNTDLVRVPYQLANRTVELCSPNIMPGKCLYLSGNHFLDQRLRDVKDTPEWSLMFWKNFAFIFIFVLSSYLINTVIYVLPLPASLKAKFRD